MSLCGRVGLKLRPVSGLEQEVSRGDHGRKSEQRKNRVLRGENSIAGHRSYDSRARSHHLLLANRGQRRHRSSVLAVFLVISRCAGGYSRFRFRLNVQQRDCADAVRGADKETSHPPSKSRTCLFSCRSAIGSRVNRPDRVDSQCRSQWVSDGPSTQCVDCLGHGGFPNRVPTHRDRVPAKPKASAEGGISTWHFTGSLSVRV